MRRDGGPCNPGAQHVLVLALGVLVTMSVRSSPAGPT
jgi:hypothetical protein